MMLHNSRKRGGTFFPDYFANSIKDINFQHLKKTGIEAMLFDLDHTLVRHGSMRIDEETVETLKRHKNDLKFFIATNRRNSSGLEKIRHDITVADIMTAKNRLAAKPAKAYYREIINMTGLSPEKLVMVGDRLVQDVWGANRAGINTVMVAKLGKVYWYDWLATIIDRVMAKIFSNGFRPV